MQPPQLVEILPNPTTQPLTLKLLNALFNGRHCIVNEAAVAQTGLEAACHIGTTSLTFQEIVMQLYRRIFGEEEIRLRQKLLCSTFNNERNAEKLIELVF